MCYCCRIAVYLLHIMADIEKTQYKVKVMQSSYRPEVAQRVPGS